MADSRITILMPLKEFHEGYLRRALHSVVRQTRSDWQLLVIVERRDLEAFRRLFRAELDDSRVALIANEGRKLARALNTGMRRGTTEFTAILLADDMWTSNAVEVLSEHIEKHPDADFFHSSRIKIDEDDAPISSVYESRAGFTLEDFKIASPVRHLMCWRRAKALAFGGMDESLDSVGPDDWDFPWTMAESGMRFQAVKDCLYQYRDHRECYRLTTHLPRSHHRNEITRIMKKHGASRAEIENKLRRAESTFLRQCLFRSKFHKLLKQALGHDARRGWRQTFK